MATVKGHKKEGGGTTRSPFLSLRIEHAPNRPDLMQFRGLWLMTPEHLKNAYNTDYMRQTDDVSRRSMEELQSDAHIIDLGWMDSIGALKTETSVIVYRTLAAGNDPDAVRLTHMVRRHFYGREDKKSYPRLESIISVLGANWTISDLLACRFKPDPTFCPPPPPPKIGGTASGLTPLRSSFPTVNEDICYVQGHTVRIGGGPGSILRCVEYSIEDDPEEGTALMHLHARPATDTALLTGTAILELRQVVTPTELNELKARPPLPPLALLTPASRLAGLRLQ